MPKVGVSLLHSAWGLSWANLNSLVLESSEGVLIHFSGAWAGMSQRLGSAGMVDYDAIMWTSSQHGGSLDSQDFFQGAGFPQSGYSKR